MLEFPDLEISVRVSRTIDSDHPDLPRSGKYVGTPHQAIWDRGFATCPRLLFSAFVLAITLVLLDLRLAIHAVLLRSQFLTLPILHRHLIHTGSNGQTDFEPRCSGQFLAWSEPSIHDSKQCWQYEQHAQVWVAWLLYKLAAYFTHPLRNIPGPFSASFSNVSAAHGMESNR